MNMKVLLSSRVISVLLILSLLLTCFPAAVRAQGAAENLCGKTISILGDSISTFAGVSNDSAVNATLSGSAVYYRAGTLGVQQADTWWQQTVDALGLKLLVNNSWSGSCVLHTRSGTVGAYSDRCLQLHNDKTGEEPDIIAVFLGTNDFSYYQSALGTADIDYDSLITANADGSFTYAIPSTSCEAYAIMLHKMTLRYPDAEVYCMTMLPRRDPVNSGADVGQPTAFNAALTKIIRRFGCTPVDLENCGITSDPANFDGYITDKRVHPGPRGMDLMTQALVNALNGQQTKLYTVTHKLDNIVVTDENARMFVAGGSYEATLTETSGFEGITVTVTMGGEDITASAYSNRKIHIQSITADIVVTARSDTYAAPKSYRWEFDGEKLISVGEYTNDLTRLAGTVTDGSFSDTRYRLGKGVILSSDLPWVIEWKGTGSGGFMLAEASDASGAPFFFRRAGNYLNAFGAYNGNRFDNYGVALNNTPIDGSAEHVYRLENRIAGDNTNMVYLWVDGTEIGPLNNHFVGGTPQGTTGSWISGRDFYINYIGTPSHPLTDYAMEYLQIWEGGEAPESLSLQYDDHYDVTGKTVEILDAGENPAVTLEENFLVATGIGTAGVRIDGKDYRVTVEKAKVNLIMIMGQSNAGNHFANATSDVTCPPGTAYWWGNGQGTAATEPVPYAQPSMGFHTPLLAELYAQSAAAGNPVKNVMIWHEGITSKNGQSIIKWASGATNTEGTDAAVAMLENCLDYYARHSDKYEIVSKGVYWLQGESDAGMDPEAYTSRFTAMWGRLKNAGMEYLAFLRVRGPHGSNTASNDDTLYNSASSAQFEMVRSNNDMFMATTLTEAWTGPVNTAHSVDVSNYITVKEAYGQSAEYSDSYGNKATYADGVLTTTMKELYGSNNKVHYGKFGYGLIGADAAYNMYAALHGGKNVRFVQTDTSGKKEAEHIASPGTVQVLDIEELACDLSFYPGSGSPAGTMQVTVVSLGKDITQQVISNEQDHYGCISVEALRAFLNPVITVSYIHGGVTDQVKYELRFDHPCQTEHTYTAAVTAPTCTEQGYTTYTCALCGDSYVADFADAAGHNYAAAVTYPAGLTRGYTDYTCTSCADAYRTAWLDAKAYEGKTIACIGDSITCGVGVTKDETDYVTLLAKQLGMDYIRLGVSGTTLCTDGSRTCNISKLTEGNVNGADVVTIAMGINDFCAAAEGYYELGDINSTDSSTIYGAARMWCERIAELRKTDSLRHTQFCFITPVIASWNNSVTSARNWDQSKVNIHGYTLRDLCNAVMEVAALYDVPVIDLNLISGIYYNNADDNNIAAFGGDGVHPGPNGHAMMAGALANALLQNDLRDDHTHTYGSWVTAKYPGCEDGEEKRVCSVCTATESRPLNSTGHSYHSVITAPTCTGQGYTTYTCTRCGYSYTADQTAATGHTQVIDKAIAPTCTEAGLTEGKHCSVCNAVLLKQNAVAATGHTQVTDEAVAPTCTEAGLTEGKHCSVCNAVLLKQNAVAATGHTQVTDKAIAPTCTEAGLTEGKHCSVCSTVLVKQNTVPAKGHTPGSPVEEDHTPDGSCDLVTYCTECAAELHREHMDSTLPGDVTGDGKVNNRDVTRLLQYLAGWAVSIDPEAADVTGDGKLNNRDVTRLLQYLAGWSVPLH